MQAAQVAQVAHAAQVEPAARLTLLRGADLVASPWKNGGGVTREIALSGSPEAFAWRVSVADVAQAGPFSRFDGVARTLVLLEGAGMVLDETDASDEIGAQARAHTLANALDVACFDGETPISARLIDGPTRDFNLMVRRDVARATFEIWRDRVAREVSGETLLLYCASGAWNVRVSDAERVVLNAGDTLRIDTADAARHARIETQGEGALLAIALESIKP
jgi:environmental stress-induced protein Ves